MIASISTEVFIVFDCIAHLFEVFSLTDQFAKHLHARAYINMAKPLK